MWQNLLKIYITWIKIGNFESGCIKTVIIGFIIYIIYDLFHESAREGDVITRYEEKLKQYIDELFDFHVPNIIPLLNKDIENGEKTYKEV